MVLLKAVQASIAMPSLKRRSWTLEQRTLPELCLLHRARFKSLRRGLPWSSMVVRDTLVNGEGRKDTERACLKSRMDRDMKVALHSAERTDMVSSMPPVAIAMRGNGTRIAHTAGVSTCMSMVALTKANGTMMRSPGVAKRRGQMALDTMESFSTAASMASAPIAQAPALLTRVSLGTTRWMAREHTGSQMGASIPDSAFTDTCMAMVAWSGRPAPDTRDPTRAT
mmetsp:Transcript_61331/g.146059  ORF Transcript_61331/g.146059 Transcript_61331/m.146059 type:complete len:225 (-) Transcript_61331:558-1232(-)